MVISRDNQLKKHLNKIYEIIGSNFSEEQKTLLLDEYKNFAKKIFNDTKYTEDFDKYWKIEFRNGIDLQNLVPFTLGKFQYLAKSINYSSKQNPRPLTDGMLFERITLMNKNRLPFVTSDELPQEILTVDYITENIFEIYKILDTKFLLPFTDKNKDFIKKVYQLIYVDLWKYIKCPYKFQEEYQEDAPPEFKDWYKTLVNFYERNRESNSPEEDFYPINLLLTKGNIEYLSQYDIYKSFKFRHLSSLEKDSVNFKDYYFTQKDLTKIIKLLNSKSDNVNILNLIDDSAEINVVKNVSLNDKFEFGDYFCDNKYYIAFESQDENNLDHGHALNGKFGGEKSKENIIEALGFDLKGKYIFNDPKLGYLTYDNGKHAEIVHNDYSFRNEKFIAMLGNEVSSIQEGRFFRYVEFLRGRDYCQLSKEIRFKLLAIGSRIFRIEYYSGGISKDAYEIPNDKSKELLVHLNLKTTNKFTTSELYELVKENNYKFSVIEITNPNDRVTDLIKSLKWN